MQWMLAIQKSTYATETLIADALKCELGYLGERKSDLNHLVYLHYPLVYIVNVSDSKEVYVQPRNR